ncbi:MAG TPA: PadR family transcriptional regulator [Bryobacteraceae bacterium]|nr:PadR family transcriptional regulator [Bryobacteraceae bacterium]
MNNRGEEFLPLPPAMLHILLTLANEDLHGYGIMQEVARQSEGLYKLGPGTLYDNLARLLDQRLVHEVSSATSGDSSRRRYYRLSSLGRSVLSMEIQRLEKLIRDGKLRLTSATPRRT